jgi:hypothetical protein
VEATTNAADGATRFTSEMPALIASERKATVAAINEDLGKLLTFIDRERIASLEQISRERIAFLQKFDEERIAATRELREIASNERTAFSRDIEQTGLRVVDRAASRLSRLVAITLGVLFLAAILLLFMIRRLFFSSRQTRRWIDNPPRAA